MLTRLEQTPLPAELEESSVVQAFLRQLTLLHYDRGQDERRDFLARWLDPEKFGRHDIVTICWLMGLATEEQELIPISRREYVEGWFIRHTELTAVRARAWIPHYLEMWGHAQEAARFADLILATRRTSGAWQEGPSITAAAAFALARARSTNRAELAKTAQYLLGRIDRGLDTADVPYPLNALKLFFELGIIPKAALKQLSRRLDATVFLSHASADKLIAQRLAIDLQQKGVQVWFDEVEIQPGDSIISKLESGLSESKFVLLLASKASLSSRWVQEELRAAQHEEIAGGTGRVVPIRVDLTPLPPFLRDRKCLSIDPYENCIRDLLRLCEVE
jgi:hypothetical protein